MSINHFLYSEVKPRYDIYVNNIDSRKITIEEPIDELKFKTQNNDVVNLSSLPDHGLPSQRLTSNGNGNVSWVSGAGTSGIEYSGGEPVQLGKLAKYSAPDGSLVNETSFIDTDILLKDGSVSMSGRLDMNNNDILNVNEIKCNNSYSNVSFTDIIKSELGTSVRFQDDIEMKSQSINNCLQVNTANISGFTAQGNINLNNNNIDNVNNMNINSINNLTPVGGIYSGISDGATISSSTFTDLLPLSSVGGLVVPANTFLLGSAFHLVCAGIFPSENKNDNVEIELCAIQGATTIQLGLVNLQLENFDTAPSNFELEADFIIRSLGVSAQVAVSFDFTFNKGITKDFKGTRATNLATFDTTQNSTLALNARIIGINGSSIKSTLAYLRKQY